MRIQVGTQVKLPEIDKLSKSVQRMVQRAVAKTAFTMEADAKKLAPVDTGALRASILVEGGAVRNLDALSKQWNRLYDMSTRRRGKTVFVTVRPPVPGNKFAAIVAPHMEYGVWQEQRKRYMQGALLKNRGLLQANVAAALAEAKK